MSSISLPRPVLLYFSDEQDSCARFTQAGQLPLAQIERHRFPDGEIKLRLPERLPAQVVILRTLSNPNEKLIELLLAAQAAHELGARHLTLVAPYFAYMRQDIAFQPGEAVSQRIVGRFLASLFNAVITVDPHLHRVALLQEAMPLDYAMVLSGAPLLTELIATRRQNPLLIGPDEESEQWVALAASRHGFEHAVCHKVRRGDRAVDIALPDVVMTGRQVVVMDDVASTGQTIAQATRLLLAAGAASVDVAVTHALFAEDALQALQTAGVGAVWSTDCISHPSNAVSMAASIAQALSQIQATMGLSSSMPSAHHIDGLRITWQRDAPRFFAPCHCVPWAQASPVRQ